MSKLVIFTNASPNYDGDPIAINKDIVASVFELIQPDANAQLQPRTIIYGVNNIDWQVKESFLEVVAALNVE